MTSPPETPDGPAAPLHPAADAPASDVGGQPAAEVEAPQTPAQEQEPVIEAKQESVPPAPPVPPHPAPSPAEHPGPAEANGEPTPEAAPTDQGWAPAPPSKKRVGLLVTVIVLVVALLGLAAGGSYLFVQLSQANDRIDELDSRIDEQNQQIEEQEEQLDRKETFGAAMTTLHDTVAPLAGLPFSDLIPWQEYDQLAARGWAHRRDVVSMDRDIQAVNEATAAMAAKIDAARAQASSNQTGTVWEETLDRLGAGWVSTSMGDVSVTCAGDPLACVRMDDPYLVHVNVDTQTDETMTDWIRTGAAYHEFAHTLQATNVEATDAALPAFGGDYETMADCYALTMLPGWSLEHTVPIDAYSYWIVDVGYGYTCNDSQRQVIRDWVAKLGIQMQPIVG